ncbi:GNAT family N-acetyltransferase [uncultured Peptoniphilus sp.]|uniref:GNAT family N-acetyltransferase n=1 Tax=uncultured Peptoniphilus sp. TaxID=254354 RepID=UPI00258ED4A8|nr:GNAT family N-acetyltransferase [uncultured Peptoniphilus sp.]MDU6783567.1 GNAT family N-acetyltransferase [Peptoniphilus harei]
MEKFKSIEELESLLYKYKDSFNNDYMNKNIYLENFNDLYYSDKGDLYIFIKKENLWKTYFYLKAYNNLEFKENLVTEVVGRNPEIEPLLKIGFSKYLTRVRFKLKRKEEYFSKRVTFIDDFNFIKDGINSFDKISGNRQSDEEILKSIEDKKVIGIKDLGFLQFSIGQYEETIEHLYVRDDARGKRIAREILKHYISNFTEKKRSTVWANEGYFVENLYLDCGYEKDKIKSIVLTY